MSSLHHHTPSLTAIDPRGLSVRSVGYYRKASQEVPQSRIHQSLYGANGFLSQQWDPRLGSLRGTARRASPPNQRVISSLSGQPLRIDSVDSGWRIALFGSALQPLDLWNARGAHQHFEYDTQSRPKVIHEQRSDEPMARCIERFVYAHTDDDDAKGNRCGRLIRHDDPSGSVLHEEYALSGVVTLQSRRFCLTPEKVDWPEESSLRDQQLEPERYSTTWHYNALGDVIEQLDAQGNKQQIDYGVAGQQASVYLRLKSGKRTLLVDQLTYNAAGQVTAEHAGNGVVTEATYSESDGQLQRLAAYRKGTRRAMLQDLAYSYDRVGNVLSILDNAQPTTWANNSTIEALNTFTYDTLYQLIKATGRENAHHAGGRTLPAALLPGSADPTLLRNYSRHYHYDAGANLVQMQHVPSSGQGYTQRLSVAQNSNRAQWVVDPASPASHSDFDPCGNLLALARGQAMDWNVRNQLQRVTNVQRDEGEDDDETYYYDGQGLRTIKRRVSRAKALKHVSEVRYLPGLELQRNQVTGEQLSVSTLQAGRSSVRALKWAQGLPQGVEDEQLRFSVSDHLGSAVLELDEQAALLSHECFYPFGATAWRAANSVFEATLKTRRYSGKERDATGLYYYGFRYYAPWLHRWVSADPAGDVDGLNRYAMVGNNPMSRVDRSGLQDEIPQGYRVIAGLSLIVLFALLGFVLGAFFDAAVSGASVGALSMSVLFVLNRLQEFIAPEQQPLLSQSEAQAEEIEFASDVTNDALKLAQQGGLSNAETVKLVNFFYNRRSSADLGLTMAIHPTASGDIYGYVGPIATKNSLLTAVSTGRPPSQKLRQLGVHSVLLRARNVSQAPSTSALGGSGAHEVVPLTKLSRQRLQKQAAHLPSSEPQTSAQALTEEPAAISVDDSAVAHLLVGAEGRSIALAISHVRQGRFRAVNWHQHADALWSADLHGYRRTRGRGAYRLMFERLSGNRYRVAGIRNPH